MPTEIYLTSGPIWAITYVKQQKIFNEEHLERREFQVRCMALLEAIDKPPHPHRRHHHHQPLAVLILKGHPRYMFSLYNVMALSKTIFMPCCIDEGFIVPNAWRGRLNLKLTALPMAGQRSIPRISSLRFLSTPVQKHILL